MVRIFQLFVAILILFLSNVSPLSAFVDNNYSKEEMAECFFLMLKECLSGHKTSQPRIKLNASDNDVARCPKCDLPFSGNFSCICGVCPYCGNKRGSWGVHNPGCVCPHCGCQNGYHINCRPNDWKELELHEFETTIKLTTEAIAKNPLNRDAYFNRGVAYFELGHFDEALNDYQSSGQGHYQLKSLYKASKEFIAGFTKGACMGVEESAVDFIPSLCHSTYGIGQTLWSFSQEPLGSTVALANSCYEIGQYVFDYCSSINWESMEEYTEQVKSVCQNFGQLNESEKGELVGYTVGKYGVELFATVLLGKTAYKGYQLVKQLRNANRLCNLEAMAISTANKKIIIAAAEEHALFRKSYFESVKYNYNSHFKHLADHHYYDGKRSIWEHPDPEGLLRRFAGKGKPKTGMPGSSGYRETVEFGEHIGIWKEDKIGGLSLPTTRGTIHYGKNGAHIVPTRPDPTIGAK